MTSALIIVAYDHIDTFVFCGFMQILAVVLYFCVKYDILKLLLLLFSMIQFCRCRDSTLCLPFQPLLTSSHHFPPYH